MKNNINIVLIGMPSAGKTTIGKRLEEKLGKRYIDMDDEIIKYANMSIPEIFQKYKESGFRKMETCIAMKLSLQDNLIIATGGGIIKFEDNMTSLKKKGVIIFIDRSLDQLIGYDPNRPLSSSKEAVKKLYEERYMLYNKYADIIVKNDTTIDECVNEIIEKYDSYINNK